LSVITRTREEEEEEEEEKEEEEGKRSSRQWILSSSQGARARHQVGKELNTTHEEIAYNCFPTRDP